MPAVSASDQIAGVYVVEPDTYSDERGLFVETFRREWFPGGHEMLQANRADRQQGCLVGLHYHLHQADYWYVPFGRARVVLHDLRAGSPTDGATGNNFLRTMLRLAEERDEVAVVDDQRGCPTFAGHLAAAVRELVDDDLPKGLWHIAGGGDCTWAEFAEAIFEEAGVPCRVRRISSAELERPAPRPAYSVLRSERAGAPTLPPWRDGLRACLAEMGG